MAYKNYPFINAITRFLQRSFFIEVLALEVLEVLEKDIKGLKRKERIKKEKKLKLKTLVKYTCEILQYLNIR